MRVIPIVAGAYDAPDRRFRRGCVHPLDGVFSLTVLGLMYGGQSLSAIYWFGNTQPQLLSWSGLRRSPSVQTLSRLGVWCRWTKCVGCCWGTSMRIIHNLRLPSYRIRSVPIA